MRPGKLLAMANQIAAFFRSYPDAEAVAGVRQHLTAFWTPVMVRTLRESLDEDAAGADRLVVAAMHWDPAAENPAAKVISPVRQAGEMASDGG